MKWRAYLAWNDETRQKGKSRMTGSAQVSHVSNVHTHVGGPEVSQTGNFADIVPSKSIASMAQNDSEANADRLRLMALREELEADFERVQRDLNVQSAAAAKTRNRLNNVRQQIVMVEEEIDMAGHFRPDVQSLARSVPSSAAPI